LKFPPSFSTFFISLITYHAPFDMQDSSGDEMVVDSAGPRRIMTAAQKSAATRMRNRALQEEADRHLLAQTGGFLTPSEPVSLNVLV
jgi:hypothetical protein